jgi:arsenical pump membrane protein
VSAVLAGAGLAAAGLAAVLRPGDAAQAAAQDWSPFVLVAGLLLIGLVADGDGLFEATGRWLAARARSEPMLFAGMVVLVSAVTATLNLDTSVAFLTPVLVHAARSRGRGEPALLYGCLLLSNAASLLLPGSNLTNLIVLGHLRLTGGQFAARMWLPWLAAIGVTAVVAGATSLRSGGEGAVDPLPVDRSPGLTRAAWLGLSAVLAATVLVIAVRGAALPVLLVGMAAAAVRIRQGRIAPGRAWNVIGAPVLAGLFGIAVALGVVGRAWSGPAVLLAHLSGWATAVVAAVASVAVNNLPAASMLAARTPPHPFSLLLGLNIGPNLCVTGSLAWLLWLRAARSAGGRPSLAVAIRLGLVAVPLALAAALAALTVTGGS